MLGRVATLGQCPYQPREIKHLIEVGLEAVPGQGLLILFLFEESPQVDAADRSSGGIKTAAHVDLLAHLGHQIRRDVEDLGLAVDERGNLKLGVQVLAVGTVAVRPTATALPLDKGAGQHIAEGTETADEAAASCEIRIIWRFQSDSNNSVR